MKVRVLFVLVVVGSLLCSAGICSVLDDVFPYFPLVENAKWFYSVRLWVYGHDPIWDLVAPMRYHELTNAEFASMGERSNEVITVLRYDRPNPVGDTVWGLYHTNLGFVLWMQRIKVVDYKYPGTIPTLYESLSQVGETAKDEYNPFLSPRQNDNLGKIEWFRVGIAWYPRTWIRYPNWTSQRWSQQWGPFGGIFLTRNYTNVRQQVMYGGRPRPGLVTKIVGPAEGMPSAVTTEIFTFIDGIGMYSRHIYTVTTAAVGPFPANTMIFRHLAVLQSHSLP